MAIRKFSEPMQRGATKGEEKGKRELKKIVVPVVQAGKVDNLPK
jgi:hypothetical protein